MGLVPLPDQYRDDVAVSFIGESVSADKPFDAEAGLELPGYEEGANVNQIIWKTGIDWAEGVVMQPQSTNLLGCTDDFTSNLDVYFAISSSLMQRTRGTVEIDVYGYNSGTLLSSQLIVLDLDPNQTTSAVAKFSFQSGSYDPVYLVKVTFPTASELTYAPAQVRYLSPIQYVLVLLGLLKP
jgi:hypothetical protein